MDRKLTTRRRFEHDKLIARKLAANFRGKEWMIWLKTEKLKAQKMKSKQLYQMFYWSSSISKTTFYN